MQMMFVTWQMIAVNSGTSLTRIFYSISSFCLYYQMCRSLTRHHISYLHGKVLQRDKYLALFPGFLLKNGGESPGNEAKNHQECTVMPMGCHGYLHSPLSCSSDWSKHDYCRITKSNLSIKNLLYSKT